MNRLCSLRTANVVTVSLILAFFLLSTSFAVTYAKTTLSKMVRTSTFVVVATVLEKESSWDDSHKKIYTYIRVKINEVLKGYNVPDEITIRQLGGQVGEEGMIVHGSPEFVIGQESILFVVDFKNNYQVHSIGMGKFDKEIENGSAYFVNPSIQTELIQTSKIKSVKTQYIKYEAGGFKNEIKHFSK
jgi:hypothetical protein